MTSPPQPPSPPADVATVVQDFYERYPYPQPVESLDAYRRQWQDPQRRRADHHCWRRCWIEPVWDVVPTFR